MNNKGVKSSPGWLIAVIAEGVCDGILLFALVVVVVVLGIVGFEV